MAGAKIANGSGVNELTMDANGYVKVSLPDGNTPSSVGGLRNFSENDTGVKRTTDPQLYSPETDLDYRLRVATDVMLEDETFNATAQNTGKYRVDNTTLTITHGTQGLLTNGGNTTTTTTGATIRSYTTFPMSGTQTTSGDFEASFSAWLVANTIIDFGFGLNSTSNPYAPTDGVYFRATSAGMVGVTNFNGAETTSGVMGFTPTLNKKYQFIVYVHHRAAEFWINDGISTDLYAVVETPSGSGQPHASAALPWFLRHSIVGGAASAITQVTLSNVSVRLGGSCYDRTLGEFGNAVYGSYQGLTGGTMGSLASYANSANPTAAVPTNTTSTVLTALGGQGWETDTLAVTTDGIIMSYQVPAATANGLGRRLKLTGIRMDSYVQTALTGGGYNAQFSLCFGHTTVSLATAEAANAKAPRRIALGAYSVASGLVALTQLPTIQLDFSSAPIYVNPSEFIAIAKKKVGTAPSAGTIAYTITPIYSWE